VIPEKEESMALESLLSLLVPVAIFGLVVGVLVLFDN
jgi:hypothetical protein